MLSAKGRDITSWRAVEDFAAAYRQALLDRAASESHGTAESVFLETCSELEAAIATHQELLKRMESLIDDVPKAASTCLVPASGLSALTESISATEAQTTTSGLLKELTATFYNDLYRHFGHFGSAPAFYQLSMAYLSRAGTAIVTLAAEQTGVHAGDLPEIALIAVGPAGRREYSPYCPLQILLVHGEVAPSQLQTFTLFCTTLHEQFEAAGLSVDPEITPRNARWRGTVAGWRQRCEEWLHPKADNDLIDLCRLVDQHPFHPDQELARDLKRISSTALKSSRPALANLISRMTSLSNGLGLMGRLKLERSGSERGMFRLLDHGLLPLSSALSALALINESEAAGNCERIRDLLRRHELDVEMTERMLAAWHSLNNLRLLLEQSFQIDGHTNLSLFVNPNELTAEQRQSLKNTLESVAVIQRHVEIIFSGMGE